MSEINQLHCLSTGVHPGGAFESVFDHNHLLSQKVGGTDFNAYEESK